MGRAALWLAAMDDQQYRAAADKALRTILDAFDEVDPDDADVDSSGDVITIAFSNGSKCVVNTQSSVHQIWAAAEGKGFHFDYDADAGAWMDDKGRGQELFALVRGVVERASGVLLDLA